MLRIDLGLRRSHGLTALAAAALLLAGCTTDGAARSAKSTEPKASDSSLHPPQGGAGAMQMTRGPEMASMTPGRLYPAVDVSSRMRFIEAIDQCGRSPDPDVLADALALRAAFEASKDEASFLEELSERFVAWEMVPAADGGKPAEGLVTGYATPVVRAKRRADSRFRYPLFVDLRRRFPEVAEASRRQILSTAGVASQAIAWVSDPLAWALIETNGSARLVFEDGIEPGELCLSRISTNGRPWTGMGRWFFEKGLIDKPNFTLADVRTTAYVHPEKAEMAALDNERVVYFALTAPDRFPTTVGLPGGRLVAGWSCAADQSVYPPGAILLVIEQTDGKQVAHLLFVHDSGGAIAGPQRVDCYLGEGDAALTRAGDLRGAARIYRLRGASAAQ
ncbi:MAG: MltA domain-containing protein [Planctomycetota bacterium]|nr:MltA domain-containing protein [Planctomycetota bacterium]